MYFLAGGGGGEARQSVRTAVNTMFAPQCALISTIHPAALLREAVATKGLPCVDPQYETAGDSGAQEKKGRAGGCWTGVKTKPITAGLPQCRPTGPHPCVCVSVQQRGRGRRRGQGGAGVGVRQASQPLMLKMQHDAAHTRLCGALS